VSEDRLQVLVLDDEPIVGKRTKPALEKYGLEVEVFVDPAAALRRLDEKHFDVVVTDVRMQQTDGLAVLERVCATGQATKVIIMTGFATMDLAQQALSKGAFEFLAKPFKAADLRAAIERAAVSLGRPVPR